MIYIDTSFLLSLLLDEKTKKSTLDAWRDDPVRISSVLLHAESLTTLRRFYKINEAKLPRNWLKNKIHLLEQLIEEVSLKFVDSSIMNILHTTEKFTDCRSLDALHLATAEFFKNALPNEKLMICTYDKNMKKTAIAAGFSVFN